MGDMNNLRVNEINRNEKRLIYKNVLKLYICIIIKIVILFCKNMEIIFILYKL